MPWIQCDLQQDGHRCSRRSFLPSRVTGQASAEAQRFRIRAGSLSGPVPDCSSSFLRIRLTERTRSRRKPCAHGCGGPKSLYSFVSAGGSTDFALNTLASSSALSAPEVAQEPSGFSSGGIFSRAPALVSNVLLKRHQPRDDADMLLSFSRIFET